MKSIVATDIGKAYRSYPTRWARLAEWVTPSRPPRHQLHWVLKNINFTLEEGEAMGIIGMNGAGKSTLLKIITGTTQPTIGNIKTQGRIAALLELGMGFHPDFTGRQNVFMSGQLLGHSPQKLDALFGEIEAFADIGHYIDQPVRTYSSGMQVRLAFAVASAIRPNILIVDEALAVGDAAFQRKCLRRIESFIKKGTSLLYVSHDIEGVKRLCTKALYLHEGTIAGFGNAKKICEQYEQKLFGSKDSNLSLTTSDTEPHGTDIQTRPSRFDPELGTQNELVYGTGEANITNVVIEDANGFKVNILNQGEEYYIKYQIDFDKSITNPVFTINIKTIDGISIYGTHSKLLKVHVGTIPTNKILFVSFKFKCSLNPGVFCLNVGVLPDDMNGFLQRRVDALIFKTICSENSERYGLVDLGAQVYANAAPKKSSPDNNRSI